MESLTRQLNVNARFLQHATGEKTRESNQLVKRAVKVAVMCVKIDFEYITLTEKTVTLV